MGTITNPALFQAAVRRAQQRKTHKPVPKRHTAVTTTTDKVGGWQAVACDHTTECRDLGISPW